MAANGDLTSQDDCNRITNLSAASECKLDGLVNSAFTAGEISPIECANLEKWRKALQGNLIGALRLVQMTLPLFDKAGGGSIVNINTNSAMRPMKAQATVSDDGALARKPAGHCNWLARIPSMPPSTGRTTPLTAKAAPLPRKKSGSICSAGVV